MLQSNSLRNLENILDQAIKTGKEEENAARVLLNVMGYEFSSGNLTVFYEILSQAKNEADKLKDIFKDDRYIKSIKDIQDLFIVNHIWNSQWKLFAEKIELKNFLITLDALAKYFDERNHKIILDPEFLKSLKDEFETLLHNISDSDLSSDLKRYLITQIEDIISVIRIYDIEGTAGLEKVTKAFVTDLVILEPSIKDVDKKKPAYKSLISTVTSLSLILSPVNLLTFVGVVPDVVEFWIPQIQNLTEIKEKVEQIINEKSNIQDIFEEVSSIFSKEDRKSLSGKNQKALPPATEIVEDDISKDF